MSHRDEDAGGDSDVDGGGLLTCCTSAGLPPAPPPPPPAAPAPLPLPPLPPPPLPPPPLRLRLTPPVLRAAAETSAGRSNDRRCDDVACPDDGFRAG